MTKKPNLTKKQAYKQLQAIELLWTNGMVTIKEYDDLRDPLWKIYEWNKNIIHHCSNCGGLLGDDILLNKMENNQEIACDVRCSC